MHIQTAFITGAASGIGRAMALRLAAQGATVFLVDRDAAGVEETAQMIGAAAAARVADVGDGPAIAALIDEAFESLGALDLVFSNAGIGRNRRLAKEVLDQEVEALFAVNLFAGLSIAQAYLRGLEARGLSGHILFTGSENSLSVPEDVKNFGLGLYGATKHGILILAEWLKTECEAVNKPLGVSILLPGGVFTGLTKGFARIEDVPAQFKMITPEACADIAVKGLELGLFYIPTHPHIATDARRRIDGVEQALEKLGLL
jgi:NAD(P)-dependent dehydrogenase (short-subunit alcohol dehydrogenase family)